MKIKITNANSANIFYTGLFNPFFLPVGTSGGSSRYGTYDQTGNIGEFIFDTAGTDFTSIVETSGGVFGQPLVTHVTNFLVRNDASTIQNGFNFSSSYRNININPSFSSNYASISFRICTTDNPLSLDNFVLVGDAENQPDANGVGSVNYNYMISKYTVTNNQYVEFLNSVASDNSEFYSISDFVGPLQITPGISRSGTQGNYTYASKPGYGNLPINYVSWHYMARYCNWLHNGKPNGPPSNSTTEDGVYPIYESRNISSTRKLGAKYFVANENEWYKAAYYKGNGTNSGYWQYATQSDTTPLPLIGRNRKINGLSVNPKIRLV